MRDFPVAVPRTRPSGQNLDSRTVTLSASCANPLEISTRLRVRYGFGCADFAPDQCWRVARGSALRTHPSLVYTFAGISFHVISLLVIYSVVRYDVVAFEEKAYAESADYGDGVPL